MTEKVYFTQETIQNPHLFGTDVITILEKRLKEHSGLFGIVCPSQYSDTISYEELLKIQNLTMLIHVFSILPENNTVAQLLFDDIYLGNYTSADSMRMIRNFFTGMFDCLSNSDKYINRLENLTRSVENSNRIEGKFYLDGFKYAGEMIPSEGGEISEQQLELLKRLLTYGTFTHEL